jgi:hypothetical protein
VGGRVSEGEFEQDEVIARVRMDRRGFVKKLIVGGVFAGPIVASFTMNDLASGATAHALGPYTPASGQPHYGHRGYHPYAGFGTYAPADFNRAG